MARVTSSLLLDFQYIPLTYRRSEYEAIRCHAIGETKLQFNFI